MHDEELPQPPARSALRSRLLLGVAVLGAVVIAAAAIAKLSTRSTPQVERSTVTVAPSAPATPTAGPTPSRTGPAVASKPPAVLHVLRRLSSAAIDAAHDDCPRLAAYCTTTGETPFAVSAALQAAFPKAGQLVAVSNLAYRDDSGPRLTLRRLSAHAGRLTIAVEIRATQPGDGVASQVVETGQQHVVRRETVVDGLDVEVQVSALAPRVIDVSRVSRLVDDSRLLETG